MRKNIIIAVLALISLVSLLFGYAQKIKAEQNEKIAMEQTIRAEQLADQVEIQEQIANEQRIIADQMMVEALHQKQIAEEQLKKYQGNK